MSTTSTTLVNAVKDIGICRACCNESDQLKSLHKRGLLLGEELTLASILSFCTNLEIDENEPFMPQHICLGCVHNLAKFYVFKKMVCGSDEILRKQQLAKHEEEEESQIDAAIEHCILIDAVASINEQHNATAEDSAAVEAAERCVKSEESADDESRCYITISAAADNESHIDSYNAVECEEQQEETEEDEEEMLTEALVLEEQEEEEELEEDEATAEQQSHVVYEEQLKVDDDDDDADGQYVNSNVGSDGVEFQPDCFEITLNNSNEEVRIVQVSDSAANEHMPTAVKRRKRAQRRTNDPNLICKFCGKQLSTFNSYKYHLQLHSENTPFVCNLCGEGFKTRNAYEGHLVSHNPNNPNTCHLCGKSYRQASSLRCHMLLHSGDKPFRCEICGKGMTQKSGYKKHLLVHTDVKPHVCDTCGREFRYSSNLIAHKRVHTNERPWECATCNKCFSSSEQMKRHMLVHAQERPFSCTLCEKTFKRRSSLITHQVTHTSDAAVAAAATVAAVATVTTEAIKLEIERPQRKKHKADDAECHVE